MSSRIVFTGNNNGWLYAFNPSTRQTLYSPIRLADAIYARSPVGTLAGETSATLFASSAGGLGYAIDANTGTIRWTSDADTNIAGIQPLGDSLVAAPVVSAARNLAFFATRNLMGNENRLFAFDAKSGACRWVLNGSCAGATNTLQLLNADGSLVWKSSSPIAGASAPLVIPELDTLYVGSADGARHPCSLTNGTAQAAVVVGAGAAAVGSPAYDTQASLFYVGTANGMLFRLNLNAICGDQLCSASQGETLASCPADCAVCGDATCTASVGETIASCPADCAVCGDHICTAGGETIASCPTDCAVCGDTSCTSATGETLTTCFVDCCRPTSRSCTSNSQCCSGSSRTLRCR